MIMLDPNSEANKGFTGAKKGYLEQLDDAFTNYPEDIKKEVFNLIKNILSIFRRNRNYYQRHL